MPLSQRPWSINSYILSMVYFRCNSINLRVKDLNSINGNLKSWLFKDQLEEPEDIILYRPTYEGGLGLDHLKCKATARLIVSFLETAVSPTYIHSIYHEALFRYHVLDEKSINNPGIPMYISEEIFEFIKLVYNEGTNIYTMTSKQWYKALLDKTVLHEKTFSLILSYGLHASFINLLVHKQKNIHAFLLKTTNLSIFSLIGKANPCLPSLRGKENPCSPSQRGKENPCLPSLRGRAWVCFPLQQGKA